MALSADVEEGLMKLSNQYSDGFTNDELFKAFPNLEKTKVTEIINHMLFHNRMKLKLTKEGTPLYLMLKNVLQTPAGLSPKEEIVYKIIAESGEKGIWKKKVRQNSNLTDDNEFKKILKSMETNKIIKIVKNQHRIFYMLYDTEPDESLAGGSFYNNQKFEQALVDMLTHQSIVYLQDREKEAIKQGGGIKSALSIRESSAASASDVLRYIRESKVVKVNLKLKDIQKVLDAIELDGTIEAVGLNLCSEPIYIHKRNLDGELLHSRNPCSVCSFVDTCAPGEAISPENCVYMTKWLEF